MPTSPTNDNLPVPDPIPTPAPPAPSEPTPTPTPTPSNPSAPTPAVPAGECNWDKAREKVCSGHVPCGNENYWYCKDARCQCETEES